MAFLYGLLVVRVLLLECGVSSDPFGRIGLRQLRKFSLVTDELRLQAVENNVQVVGVVATLRPNLLPFGLRFTLGFCGFSRLATVICVLHLAGFPRENLGLPDFLVAEVNLGIVVLGFDLFCRLLGLLGFLALFGRFLRLGRLLLGLFLSAHQQGHSSVVAGLAAIFGEIRVAGCLVGHGATSGAGLDRGMRLPS
ncbi:hypothetical protein ACFQZQ_02915 [Lysobacter koreensis]|uniref:Secreted protein n=1 Tax=Lysobacter koreensis TaxID=266122 RepID=A0ABW2YIJ5_9GAMM